MILIYDVYYRAGGYYGECSYKEKAWYESEGYILVIKCE